MYLEPQDSVAGSRLEELLSKETRGSSFVATNMGRSSIWGRAAPIRTSLPPGCSAYSRNLSRAYGRACRFMECGELKLERCWICIPRRCTFQDLSTWTLLSGCPMDYPTLPIGFHWAPLGGSWYKPPTLGSVPSTLNPLYLDLLSLLIDSIPEIQ